jgi:hypothetical protein
MTGLPVVRDACTLPKNITRWCILSRCCLILSQLEPRLAIETP